MTEHGQRESLLQNPTLKKPRTPKATEASLPFWAQPIPWTIGRNRTIAHISWPKQKNWRTNSRNDWRSPA